MFSSLEGTLAMIELRHRPSGWGHPYESGPDERAPRCPVTGEPIRIKAISAPVGALGRVRVEWCFDRGDWKTAFSEGSQVMDAEEAWAVDLPTFSEPGCLIYRLTGETPAGDDLAAGEFQVEIADWRTADRFLGIKGEGSSLVCRYGFKDMPLVIRRRIFLDEAHNLHLETNKGDDGGQVPVGEGAWTAGSAPNQWENGAVRVAVEGKDGRLTIQQDGRVVFREIHPFEVRQTAASQLSGIRLRLESRDEEQFLGLGERFNTLDQRGMTLDTRVFEQYRHQGSKTYLPVPFFVASSGYGLYVDSSRRCEFHFPDAAQKALILLQETPDQLNSSLILFPDQDLANIVRRFTRYMTLPALPPVWAFGLWMSSNEWYTQAEVLHQKDLMEKHKIPATVLVIEAWSDEKNFYIWNDAQYPALDPSVRPYLADFTFPEGGSWPDPKGMTEDLHEAGLRLILWQIPVLKHLFPEDLEKYGQGDQHDRDEAFMIEKGYCVHRADGSPYRVPPIWFSNSLVLDVTHPEAVAWWLGKRQYLLDEIGIDGFKTDGGEHLWGDDLVFADGRTNAELWNAYPALYTRAYYEFANRHRPQGAITFSRAGFTGSQASPCHWAGDQVSTWEAFRAVLLAGQNLGISGVPFWGWDIGGFSGPIPTAELYLRSTAAAAFAPVMQYHSEHNQHRPVSVDRTPWNIQVQTGDERVLPIFRKFANLRMNLLPYLYSEAEHASRTGEPLFGCPFIRFQDPKLLDFPYQFMCGRELLVAPVVEPGAEYWRVYLPEGSWRDFWTGKALEGGSVHEVSAGIDSLPVFIREGARITLHLNPAGEMGGEISNCLDGYDVLTVAAFGSAEGETVPEWFDYVTRRSYQLSPDIEHAVGQTCLMDVCQEIRWIQY
jgi:alpha-glucosidase (family GH31 glycosyl hydrolase)